MKSNPFQAAALVIAMLVGAPLRADAAAQGPLPTTVLEAARSVTADSGQLTRLSEMLAMERNLKRLLEGEGSFTVFAPNDQAFDELYRLAACGAIDLNGNLVNTILNYHILRGVQRAGAGPAGRSVEARSRIGAPLSIAAHGVTDAGGRVARIEHHNLEAANGVVHVIDRVLWPFPAPTCG